MFVCEVLTISLNEQANRRTGPNQTEAGTLSAETSRAVEDLLDALADSLADSLKFDHQSRPDARRALYL